MRAGQETDIARRKNRAAHDVPRADSARRRLREPAGTRADRQGAGEAPARRNESLAMIVSARGVQIYECRSRKQPDGGFEWAFAAPEADLFDARGSRIGRHYAGPHWEAMDGSKIVGTVKERADAPLADSIPWLLLTAKSVGPEGSFSKATSIQRVNTVGGVAPATGCSEATAGTAARISYTADYYFFTAR